VIPVVLDLGAEESLEFATVLRWLVSEGDRVTASQTVVEVEAEKVSYEIEAPAAGVLAEVIAVAGDEVRVGSTLAMIEEG